MQFVTLDCLMPRDNETEEEKVYAILECSNITTKSTWKYMRGQKDSPLFTVATNFNYSVQVSCEK